MLTLSNQRDLTNDMLIKGIIDSVVTVNQFYAMLPFKGIQGNALAYNRESFVDQMTLVSVLNTDGGEISKDQQTFTRHSTELTTLIGDAQVNGLIQAVGSDYNDATAVQVAAKAKGLGRKYMDLLINGNNRAFELGADVANDVAAALLVRAGAVAGDGSAITGTTVLNDLVIIISRHTGGVSSPSTFTDIYSSGTILSQAGADALNFAANIAGGYTGFDGIDALAVNVSAGTYTLPGTAQGDGNVVLNYLDSLIDRVKDKDGMVDYMMMNSGALRAITAAFRGVGTGFDMMDVKNSSGGVMSIQSYRGVPMFRNDFIGNSALVNSQASSFTAGDSAASKDIFIGTLDDGSMTHGICGLTAVKSAGMQVQKLGAMEATDADITRVKWYCGLASFSDLGLVKGTLV